MDLKCFRCITDEWAAMRDSGNRPKDAVANAAEAVTIYNGAALCADHAAHANDLPELKQSGVPRRVR